MVGSKLISHSLENVLIKNVTSTNAMLMLRWPNSFDLKNIHVENSTANSQYLISADGIPSIAIKNLTCINLRGQNTDTYSLVYINVVSAGNITIDGLSLKQSQIHLHNGIYASSVSQFNLVIKNVEFSDITMGSGKSVLKTDPLNSLYMSNFTINGVVQEELSGLSNVILNIGAMNLNTTGTFVIDNISVSNSTVEMLRCSNLKNPNVANKSIRISDLSYKDSYFEYAQNLVRISDIETNSNLNIIFDQVKMSNLTFVRGGYLILFQQQTAEFLQLTNSVFTNINGGSIHVESYNKNNLGLTTNVKISNMTAENNNGYYNSFFTITMGGVVYLHDSSFQNLYNYEKGAVVYINSPSSDFHAFN